MLQHVPNHSSSRPAPGMIVTRIHIDGRLEWEQTRHINPIVNFLIIITQNDPNAFLGVSLGRQFMPNPFNGGSVGEVHIVAFFFGEIQLFFSKLVGSVNDLLFDAHTCSCSCCCFDFGF